MSRISRRRFLEDSALLLAAASFPGRLLAADAPRSGRRVGPNDKIHIACIGVNGRGMSHVNDFAGMDEVVVTHICDPDVRVFPKAVKAVVDKGDPEPKTVQDIRELLDDPSIDAVAIATPNHWHSLGAIWAMQAGKDVYVEKPVSHNVFEGRKMVEAARKYGRICQAGTQSRSNEGMRKAMRYLHDGKLGRVTLARGLCYKRRDSIGRVSVPQPVPDTVDYNLWLGPAPKEPIMRQSFHYDWHWQWDYGNGDLGNQGSHEMDKARWGLGKNELPKSVMTFGYRFGYRDNGETPNTEISFFDYGDSQLIFEVRGLETPDLMGAKVGNIFYGTEGTLVCPSYSGGYVLDKSGNKIEEFGGGGNHYRNFIDAVRSRRVSDLTCDIEEGHLSAALCHLANISYKMGPIQPLSSRPDFDGYKDAQETYDRFLEHLKTNGVSPSNWSYRIGPKLEIDPKTETFVDSAWANQLLTREYREPFVVRNRV